MRLLTIYSIECEISNPIASCNEDINVSKSTGRDLLLECFKLILMVPSLHIWIVFLVVISLRDEFDNLVKGF